MAPAYALIVSFVLVLIVGSILPKTQAQTPGSTADPTGMKPPAGAKVIRFEVTPMGLPKAPQVGVADLQGRQVQLLGSNGRISATVKLADDGLLAAPITPFYVCMVIPDGWSTASGNGKKQPNSNQTCWGLFPPEQDAIVQLTGPRD